MPNIMVVNFNLCQHSDFSPDILCFYTCTDCPRPVLSVPAESCIFGGPHVTPVLPTPTSPHPLDNTKS